MRIRQHALRVAGILLIAFAIPAHAQTLVQTGLPPFGSFSGGPDVIDNANLNVHYTIPIRQKAGRGTDFDYSLGYDSSIWYQVFNGSKTVWQPVSTWGWSQGLASGGAYVLYSMTYQGPTTCGPQNYGYSYQEWTFSNFTFFDSVGTPHYFPASATYIQDNGGTLGCPTPGSSDPNGIVAQSDVYTISLGPAGAGSISLNSLQGPGGGNINVPFVTTPPGLSVPTSSVTDRNGNEITVSNGVYTDTLGQPALTIANGSTTTYSYTAPSSGTATYTISYSTYTVRTNFGCSGTSEYGPTSKSLVNKVTLPDGSYYQLTYEATPGYSGDVTGRVASVHLPTGGTISYTYTGSNNGILCSGDGMNSTAGLQRSTPDTGSGHWTYSRTIGTYPNPDTTTITDPQGNQTVVTFPEYSLLETQRVVNQGASTQLETISTSYQSGNPVGQKTVIASWPNGSGGTLQSKTVTTYNSNELVTEVDEYGYGSGGPGSLVRKTLTTYASLGNGIVDMPASVTIEDGSSNVAAQTTYCYDEATPSRSTTCGTTGPPTATSGTPQHVSITGSRGNTTTINSLVSGSTYLSKGFSYYDTGNVNAATDVNGGVTTPSYSSTGSCGNSFPTSVTEAVSGLSRSMTWNCTGGVQLTSVDENNQTTTIAYSDPYYWRPASATDPTSATAYYSYTPSPQYPTVFSTASSLEFNSNSSIVYHQNYLDSLGRVYVNQVLQAPGGSSLDSVSQTFDSDGRLHSVSMPCSTGYSGTCSTPQTTQTYDALNRPLVTTDGGGGTVTLSYIANDAYSSRGPAPPSENAKRRQYEYDALGRLTSVCEVTGGTPPWPGGNCAQTNPQTGYWTKYTYDLLNDLTGVTQNAQSSTTQSRTYQYDDLGRLTKEITPESGTVTYQYDTQSICWQASLSGDLTVRTDNAGNVTCYLYDKLHRLTDVAGWANNNWTANNGPCRRYRYDATSNGIGGSAPSGVTVGNIKGRLMEVETDICGLTPITDEWFGYTQRGQVSDLYASTPHSGVYNHSAATYWANGVMNALTGANGYSTNYGVDGEGRVSSTANGAGLASTTYNPASQPLTLNFASGDGDSFTYDPNTGRMTQYKFTVTGQSVVGTLTWNPNGSLGSLAITDPFNSANAQTCAYAHDDVGRIGSDNCGSGWSQTFNYDAFGNISKSGTQSFLPTYNAATNQMTSIGSHTPTYDANGNVTNDYLNSYTSWDQYGRPTAVNGVGITYDALGRAVELNKSGTYNEIQYSPTGFKMQLLNGSTLVKGFVPMPGGTAEVWTGSGANYYRHSDWLGSSRLASNFNRTIYGDVAYGPFGEPYAQSGTSDLSFTGMNQDISSNVYDFPAREYGIQGRWPSPDPAGLAAADSSDPQSWNLYSYVRNSPLSLTDPLGLKDSDPCFWADFPDPFGNEWEWEVNDDGDGVQLCQGRGGGGVDGGGGGGTPPAPPPPTPPKTCTTATDPFTTNGIGFGGIAAASGRPLTPGGSAAQGDVAFVASNQQNAVTASGGALTTSGNYVNGAPSQPTGGNVSIFGAYVGGGLAVTTSNGQPTQLRGPFSTLTVAGGLGPINFSVTMSCSGSVCQYTIGAPIISWGLGFVVTGYRTSTAVQTITKKGPC